MTSEFDNPGSLSNHQFFPPSIPSIADVFCTAYERIAGLQTYSTSSHINPVPLSAILLPFPASPALRPCQTRTRAGRQWLARSVLGPVRCVTQARRRCWTRVGPRRERRLRSDRIIRQSGATSCRNTCHFVKNNWIQDALGMGPAGIWRPLVTCLQHFGRGNFTVCVKIDVNVVSVEALIVTACLIQGNMRHQGISSSLPHLLLHILFPHTLLHVLQTLAFSN